LTRFTPRAVSIKREERRASFFPPPKEEVIEDSEENDSLHIAKKLFSVIRIGPKSPLGLGRGKRDEGSEIVFSGVIEGETEKREGTIRSPYQKAKGKGPLSRPGGRKAQIFYDRGI